MRLLLILPDGGIHKLQIGRFQRSMREAPLTLTMLAALVPPELGIEIKLVDENVDTLPLGQAFDLVAVSVLTGTSVRAYQLSSHFRSKGIPVVLGGIHVGLMPEEARQHADHLIIGPAEKTWPQFLRDFVRGRPQSQYIETKTSGDALSGLPRPRRELQSNAQYNMAYTVMATRGCRHSCSFCSVPVSWQGYVKRPVGEVVDDIKQCRGNLFAFNDVSLMDDTEYAKALFKAIIPLKKRWGGLATVKVADDPELLKLMAESGCRYLLIGFESFDRDSLLKINKGFNRRSRYQTLMEALHGFGISVQGCFIFGFDQDDESIFEQTVSQVNELKIDIPRYAILTPYPGTPLYRELMDQDRILTWNWQNYDTMHVVFQPRQMTTEQLYTGFKWAYRETFRLPSIFKRIGAWRFAGLINLVGNMTYRRFVKRLDTHPRFLSPFLPASDLPTDRTELVTGGLN